MERTVHFPCRGGKDAARAFFCKVTEGGHNAKADVPAQTAPPQAEAWLPGTYAHPWRAARPQAAAAEGAVEADRF